MESRSPYETLSAEDYAAFREGAKRRAVQLRREAMTEIWRGLVHAIQRLASTFNSAGSPSPRTCRASCRHDA